MKRRRSTRASLNPNDYPTPRKWPRGFVSKAQVNHFKRTPTLSKYINGMWANVRIGRTRAEKMRGLPARLHPKARPGRRRRTKVKRRR